MTDKNNISSKRKQERKTTDERVLIVQESFAAPVQHLILYD